MKILTLCYEYPPLGGGGGRVAKDIAEQMASRGHDVRVQTAALGWRSTRETTNGVEVFRAASGRRVPDTCTVREMGQYVATSFLPTLSHIRTWKPDIIHAHFAVPTGALAWGAHRITGVPYVLTAHLGDVPGGVPDQTDRLFRFVAPITRRIWKDAAAATAVSSFVQELAERAYGRPVIRILNGIDRQYPPPAPRPPDRVRHLLFIGRFNAQKNPLFLIDALAALRGVSWYLTMIGDGPLKDRIQARIAYRGLSAHITCTGWLDATDVQRFLSDADILCMPSLSEGMPMAAIEALAHGVAIMASDIPGMRDVLEPGVTGFCVSLDPNGESAEPPFLNSPLATSSTLHEACFEGPVAAFAHKLQWLIESETTLSAMRHASWEKSRTFDLRLIADEYEAVLTKAAQTGRPRHGA